MRPLSGIPTFDPEQPATALLEHTQPDDDGLAFVIDADRLVGTVDRRDLARMVDRLAATSHTDH